MAGNQDDDRPGFGLTESDFKKAVDVEEVAHRFNVSPEIAARENRPGVLRQLIQEGNPIHIQDPNGWTPLHHAAFLGHAECVRILLNEETCNIEDHYGWTALHHAAFLGHAECVRILLNEETCNIDHETNDGSTPLTAACANLPISKECVKVLCEHKANPNLFSKMSPGYYDQTLKTALLLAMETMPDLEVIKWLVGGGADVEKYVQIWEDGRGGHDMTYKDNLALEMGNDLMMCLFKGEFRGLWADPNHPAYDFANHAMQVQPLKPDASEVAEIAMYLAKHGAVRHGYALAAVLLSFHDGYVLTPQSLNEVVECFLENGAVLNKEDILDQEFNVWMPSVFILFARKSIIFLEGVPTSIDWDVISFPLINALMVLVLKGQASGTLPISAIEETHREFECFGEGMAENFRRPLENLYAMTKSPPSLKQLARTKIRTHVAECKKFCRENLKKLPDLPDILKDYVQLADLRYGSELEQIMELAKNEPLY